MFKTTFAARSSSKILNSVVGCVGQTKPSLYSLDPPRAPRRALTSLKDRTEQVKYTLCQYLFYVILYSWQILLNVLQLLLTESRVYKPTWAQPGICYGGQKRGSEGPSPGSPSAWSSDKTPVVVWRRSPQKPDAHAEYSTERNS